MWIAGDDCGDPLSTSFLHSQSGRTAFADLVIGSFGGEIVHFMKEDEFADRFFSEQLAVGR
jgi:hypothetical protein